MRLSPLYILAIKEVHYLTATSLKFLPASKDNKREDC